MIKYEIDEEIYSYEALRIAKNIIDKENLITLDKKNSKIEIIVKKNDDFLFNKFMNEALSQQCRIDIAKINQKVAEMLTTIAIVSALNKKNKEE